MVAMARTDLDNQGLDLHNYIWLDRYAIVKKEVMFPTVISSVPADPCLPLLSLNRESTAYIM